MLIQASGTQGESRFLVRNNGEVCIGCTNADAGSLLTVSGKITCKELEVKEIDKGADFVFEDDYKLRDLKEVKAFIQKNNHLPEIAPAAEMIENGVNMGEFQIQLLQKVEELTLYMIEMKEDNDALRAEINELKK